ncbi:alpha/beta hydrolase [Shinella zoogloeoides]|uniref:alpha/beta fold hydrolase n=1 Tax=Shinella zoogloeoides TaxID=352475 RepID=UPI0028AC6C6E|nr:alpha/beta hydrolase [Shinella zoogloeoides]
MDKSGFTYTGSDGCRLSASVLADNASGKNVDTVVVMLHGGGPDHHSMEPLARSLTAGMRILLPDIRGYGRSICCDPARHTWAQYVDDLFTLIDHVGARRAVVVGAGIGTTIALRAAKARPDQVAGAVLISVEDIENDAAKAKETRLLQQFADDVRRKGLEETWGPILAHFPPVIGRLVREAIPRADPESIAAAAAIGYDRSFRSVEELRDVLAPMLIVPGTDFHHPRRVAEDLARVMPNAELASISFDASIRDAQDMASRLMEPINSFLCLLGPT